MRAKRIRFIVLCLVACACLPLVSAAPAQAVTSQVRSGFLLVRGGPSADSIAMSCEGGYVKVNGMDPKTGSHLCRYLEGVTISAGAGADRVDLSAVRDGYRFQFVGNSVIQGEGGDDVLVGSGGTDRIYGQAGDDFLMGGPGVDRLWPGVDGGRVDGGPGGATLQVKGGSWVITRTVARQVSPHGLEIPFTRIRFASVGGGSRDDRLDTRRFDGPVTLKGGRGDDVLLSGDGRDTIYGQAGEDLVNAGRGVDFLFGGFGRDVLKGRRGDDGLRGGPQIDQCLGGPGQDDLRHCE